MNTLQATLMVKALKSIRLTKEVILRKQNFSPDNLRLYDGSGSAGGWFSGTKCKSVRKEKLGGRYFSFFLVPLWTMEAGKKTKKKHHQGMFVCNNLQTCNRNGSLLYKKYDDCYK